MMKMRLSDYLWVSVLLIFSWWTSAQEMPPSPVEFTEAKQHMMQQEIRISGTVRARTGGTIAAGVAGIVVEVLVEEGTTVRKGQPLLRVDSERIKLQIEAAEGNLREAGARLELAQSRLKRAQELFRDEVFSQQQLDDNRYEVQALDGRRIQLQATIAQYRLDLERATVRAPYPGVTTAKHAELGQWLPLGGTAFELASNEDTVVWVEVPERFYAGLRVGDPVHVTFDALPDRLAGNILAVIPRASETRTIPVKIKIPNEGGRIPEGILAHVSFKAGESYTATMVPKDAIVSRGEEKQIFIMDRDRKVAPVTVQTGLGSGVWVEVIGDVQPGQKVITLGNERLQPGQTVMGQKRSYD